MKIKTKKSAYKRFKKTSTGFFKHKQSHTRHMLLKKSSKRKRHLRKLKLVDVSSKRCLKKLMPYV